MSEEIKDISKTLHDFKNTMLLYTRKNNKDIAKIDFAHDGSRLVHCNLPTEQSLCVAQDNVCNTLQTTAFTK